MLIFHWFYIVFWFSMHLAFWLILLALGGVHVASEIEIVGFSIVLNTSALFMFLLKMEFLTALGFYSILCKTHENAKQKS